jgi:hypothetical protein
MGHADIEIAMLQRDHSRAILRKERNLYRLSRQSKNFTQTVGL